MIASLIRWSARNVFLVGLATRLRHARRHLRRLEMPLDAIPDLSDVQVIVYTEYPGPGAAGGRGPGHLSADHGDADRAAGESGARLLVLRRLLRLRHFRGRHRHLLGALPGARISELAAARLPAGVTPTLGPDATGVGWVYQYVVRGAQKNLAELRTIQDWYVRYQLAKAEGVAEVASVGGFVKQYRSWSIRAGCRRSASRCRTFAT